MTNGRKINNVREDRQGKEIEKMTGPEQTW